MDKNKKAVEVFDKLARLYQEKFMDVNSYADTFNFFCDAIPTINADILELACGPGNISRYVLNKRPDFKLLGTDLAYNMIELAKTNNPEAEFQVMDCRSIDRLTKKYDGLICGFCLPYLSMEETAALIKSASLVLKPGGLFYLSTMEDEYKNSTFKKGSSGDEIFMHYYMAGDLTFMLQQNQFSILNLSRKNYTNPDGSLTVDLILIAKKQ